MAGTQRAGQHQEQWTLTFTFRLCTAVSFNQEPTSGLSRNQLTAGLAAADGRATCHSANYAGMEESRNLLTYS